MEFAAHHLSEHMGDLLGDGSNGIGPYRRRLCQLVGERRLQPDVAVGSLSELRLAERATPDHVEDEALAQWGAPDDTVGGCHSRKEVLAWYARAREAGVRARVTEVVIGDGALLVGLSVSGTEEAEEARGEVDRW